MAMVDTLY